MKINENSEYFGKQNTLQVSAVRKNVTWNQVNKLLKNVIELSALLFRLVM